MKKCCLYAALLILISQTASAQIKKNSLFLGGGAGYYSYSGQNGTDGLKTTYKSGDYGVVAGKAFRENSIVGISFHFRPQKQENYLYGDDTINIHSNWYLPGIFLREYRKIGKDFYLFAEVGADVQFGKLHEDHSYTSRNVNGDIWGGSVSLTPGISYQATKRMQIELSLPNALILQYTQTNFQGEDPQVDKAKEERLIFSAPLIGNMNGISTIFAGLGLGFRFIL